MSTFNTFTYDPTIFDTDSAENICPSAGISADVNFEASAALNLFLNNASDRWVIIKITNGVVTDRLAVAPNGGINTMAVSAALQNGFKNVSVNVLREGQHEADSGI